MDAEEDNFPAQCHPILKIKKKKPEENKNETM